MATRTPLHQILDEEAKARSYKRSGVGWAKDHGSVVAKIELYRHKNVKGRYFCEISLFIKLDHVPQVYEHLIEKFSPRMIHIYLAPKRAPDGVSHLLKIVRKTEVGPSFEEDPETRRRIRKALRLERDGSLSQQAAHDARRFLVAWGLDLLEICKTRAELVERCQRDDPPFGIFMRNARAYLDVPPDQEPSRLALFRRPADRYPVPIFDLPVLNDPEARLTNILLARGGPSVLTVWNSGYQPCQRSHPQLMKLRDMDVAPIYGLNVINKPETVSAFLSRHGDPYALCGYDRSGQAAEDRRTGSSVDWNGPPLPSIFVVDGAGLEVHGHYGLLTQRLLDRDILPAIELARRESRE